LALWVNLRKSTSSGQPWCWDGAWVQAYPTAAALKRAGNEVISIVGARNKKLVILEREMRAVSDTLIVTTDDGSYGQKGLVTDWLRELIARGTQIDLVLAAGPVVMMRAVAEPTARWGFARWSASIPS